MDTTGTVTVTGHGQATGTPDRATVNLGVEVRGATAVDALGAANERAATLLEALRGFGLDAEDLRTRDVSLHPQFDSTTQAVTGYVAGNQVSATVRDISRVGEVLDAVARLVGDAVRFNGLSFAITDPAELLRAARAAATDDARAKAAELAALHGATLGAVVHIAEGSTVGPPVPRFAKAMAMDAGVPVEAGSQVLGADVTVTYRLIEAEH